MTRMWIAAGVAFLMTACSDSSSAPSPTTPTPRVTYTLSGTVFAETANGWAPVAGVRVRLEEGLFSRDAMTDGNGFYSMTGLDGGGSPSITATKATYEPETQKVTIRADMRLDIRIVPLVPHTLS